MNVLDVGSSQGEGEQSTTARPETDVLAVTSPAGHPHPALESGDPATSAPGVGTEPAPTSHPALMFTVYGTPVPQGSHKAFVVNNRAVITNDNKKTRPWRTDVQHAALEALRVGPENQQGMAERVGFPFGTGPVDVQVEFVMPRPKAHYRTGRHAELLRDNAPHFPSSKPDTDKLLRALLDACTAAGVWRDDAQVAQILATKRYADPQEPPAAYVQITALTS